MHCKVVINYRSLFIVLLYHSFVVISLLHLDCIFVCQQEHNLYTMATNLTHNQFTGYRILHWRKYDMIYKAYMGLGSWVQSCHADDWLHKIDRMTISAIPVCIIPATLQHKDCDDWFILVEKSLCEWQGWCDFSKWGN